jgi:hypothetical protein
MRLIPLLAIPLLSVHALAVAQEASPRFSPEGVCVPVTVVPARN